MISFNRGFMHLNIRFLVVTIEIQEGVNLKPALSV